MPHNEPDSKQTKDYSSFCPREYYEEYYSKLGAENAFLLNFFHRAYEHTPSDSRLLEFGGGPTIYQLISAAMRIKEIVFADYLAVNRREVKLWIDQNKTALNWDTYLRYVLRLNSKEDDQINLGRLNETVTSKITEVIECDAYLPNVLGSRFDNKFDIVSSNFCLECIDGSEENFVTFIEKISGLIEKKGKLVLTMLKNSYSYQINEMEFPAFPINEDFIHSLLKRMDFSEIELCRREAEQNQGYEGIIAITAKKR